MSRRLRALALAGGLACSAIWWAATGEGAGAQQLCRTTTVEWSAPPGLYISSGHLPLYDTGRSIPAGEPGETIEVVGSSYRSSDRYPEGSSPTREQAAQLNERWRLQIGGVPFGQLTDDVLDRVADGAPSPWYSGELGGSLGSGPVTAGPIVIRHASLEGYTESPNSVRPQAFSLTVAYCRELEVPTTTSVEQQPSSSEPPTTAAPTTSDPASPSVDAAPTTVDDGSSSVPDAPPSTVADPGPIPRDTAAPSPGAPTTGVPTTDPDGGATPSLPPTTDPVPSTLVTVPSPTTSPTTSTTPTSTTIIAAGPAPGPEPSSPAGNLPSTGADLAAPVTLATLCAGLGALLRFTARRRRPTA